MKKVFLLFAVLLTLVLSGCRSSGGNSTQSDPCAPAITSADSTTLTEGTAGTYTVTATGTPTPTFVLTGTLPSGVTFDATTGVLSGTPAEGSSGNYPLIITASNGVSPDATQSFTLTVVIPPITSLTEVGQIDTGDANVVICSGNYAYTVGWDATSNSFSIVDMSDPTTPAITGSYNIGLGYGLALNGNYAYIQTDGSGDGIFASGTVGVMNITDPTNPVPVMQNNSGYVSAFQVYYYNGYVYSASQSIIGIYSVVNDPSTLVPVTNISTTGIYWLALSDNYMYGNDADGISTGTLSIWDISNPAAPTKTGSISDADLYDGDGIAVNGNYVFAMGATTGGEVEILVYNVSDKTNPTLVTKLALTGGTSTYSNEARILGNYLLIAGDNDFYVVNIADPTVPIEITSFALTNGGGWGFDVLNDRYAIVADNTVYHVIKLW